MENATHTPPDSAHGGDGSTAADAESPRLGYEVKDATLRPIIIFMVVMVVSAVLIHGAVWWMMELMKHQNANADATPSPFAGVDHPNPPPDPKLQPSVTHDKQPFEDMEDLRKKWRKMLTTYGPVEGQPDRARIPVEEAMKQAIERGLPNAPTTQPATRPAGGGV